MFELISVIIPALLFVFVSLLAFENYNIRKRLRVIGAQNFVLNLKLKDQKREIDAINEKLGHWFPY